MYSDFDFYQNTYLGELDEPYYNKFGVRANLYIKNETMGRIVLDELDEESQKNIKLCECELLDLISVCNYSAYNPFVKSESLGEHSISYKDDTRLAFYNSMSSIINLYLSDIKIDGISILYSGICHIDTRF